MDKQFMTHARDAELMGEDIVGLFLSAEAQRGENAITSEDKPKLRRFIHDQENIEQPLCDRQRRTWRRSARIYQGQQVCFESSKYLFHNSSTDLTYGSVQKVETTRSHLLLLRTSPLYNTPCLREQSLCSTRIAEREWNVGCQVPWLDEIVR